MGVVWPVWGTVHKTLCGLHHLVEKGEMVRLLTEVQKMEETLVSVGRRRELEFTTDSAGKQREAHRDASRGCRKSSFEF